MYRKLAVFTVFIFLLIPQAGSVLAEPSKSPTQKFMFERNVLRFSLSGTGYSPPLPMQLNFRLFSPNLLPNGGTASPANIRSTTHRLGNRTKPSALSERLMISTVHLPSAFRASRSFGPAYSRPQRHDAMSGRIFWPL